MNLEQEIVCICMNVQACDDLIANWGETFLLPSLFEN